MTSSNHESRRNGDHPSAESHYALLAALTVIKAQAQMLGRWARRNPGPDTDVVLRRLQAIDHMVGRMVGELDAMTRPPGSGDDPDDPTS